MRARTRVGQDTNGDGVAALEEFGSHVLELAQTEGVSIIYNADQTGIFYEYLPRKTVHATGSKTIWMKCGGGTKNQATAMLLGDINGHQYPLFLVFKTQKSTIELVNEANMQERNGFGRRLWSEIDELQNQFDCQIYGNTTAWWNQAMSLEFLDYHF
ncbi:hypothetical protein AC1031_000911, partial [Aphanomyces cochlioides]